MNAIEESSVLRFADVEIDVREGRVLRPGSEQHLRQKVFQVLLYLIEHRDRTVSRDELIANVWAGTFVTDDALVQCIVDLRRAFGDDARNPQFIRTIPKRGYRFIASDPSPVAMTVEESESIQYEVLEDTPAPEPRRWNAIVVPALAVAVALLSGAAYLAARGREPAGPNRAVAPIDSPTPSAEAFHLYSLALRKGHAHRTGEAVALFEQALRLDPEYAMARARIGWIYGVVESDIARGKPHIERALALSRRLNDRERMHVLAWQDILNKDYPEAIDRYRVILERHPTDIEAYHRLAKLLAGEEQIEAALEILDRAEAIEPRSPLILNSLGGMSSVAGRHDKAIAAHRKYVEIAPHEANAWDSLGVTYHWAGRYDDALDAYAHALELQPDFTLPRFHRAATYAQLGRFDEAVRDVEVCLAAAKTDNERARVHATVAELYRLKGDDARMRAAEARIPRGVGWDPVRRLVEERRESWKDDPSRWESARAIAGRGQRSDRRTELYWSGHAAMTLGRHEEALLQFRRALRFRPLIWYVDSFETCLADAYLELGRFDEAAGEYRRVLGINENYARARFGLARALEGLGKRAEARVEYERFLELWKDADANARERVEARRRVATL